MNEQEALQVLLVKAFETQAPHDELLSETERREATRTALDTVGPEADPDTFIARRAQAASIVLAKGHSAVNRLLAQPRWHPTLVLLAIGVGLVVGITADVFGSGRELNLLAPPAWLVILWNLGVYIVLCWRLVGGEPDKASPRAGWARNAVAAALGNFRFRHLQKLVSSSAPSAQAFIDFGTTWSRASLPLATTRLVMALHAAAAGVAIALIAGMYLRGMAFEYRVGWGSTFLDTESVHAFLSWLLAPALWLSGIQLPEAAQMEALRDASELDRTQASAAPWIHLYAIMLFIVVVVPRALLACWSGWQAHRMSVHFPLSLDEPYYRNILRARRNDPIRIHVLPYAQSLPGDTQENLRRILELAFDNSPQIEFAATTTQGGEDDLGILCANLANTTHLVALFDMTATPEPEYHGAFLSALAGAQAPVIVVVNESSFASRFRDYPQRLTERRESWTAFCNTGHCNPLFFDLVSPQMASYVTALRSSLDELTAA